MGGVVKTMLSPVADQISLVRLPIFHWETCPVRPVLGEIEDAVSEIASVKR